VEEGHVPAIKLEIAIGDVVLADGHSHRWRAAVPVIRRSASVTMIAAGADLKIYIATRRSTSAVATMGLRRRCRRCFARPVQRRSLRVPIETSDRIKILVWIERAGVSS